MIADDAVGPAPDPDHGVELAGDTMAADRSIGEPADSLTGTVIDHRSQAEASRRSERVRDKVNVPSGVGGIGNFIRHRYDVPDRYILIDVSGARLGEFYAAMSAALA